VELVGDRPRVRQRAREPVELRHDLRVAGAACRQRLTQPGTVPVGAGEAVIDLDPLGFYVERLKRVAPGGEVLRIGGDAGVPDPKLGHVGEYAG
jgi:hypothetical protein